MTIPVAITSDKDVEKDQVKSANSDSTASSASSSAASCSSHDDSASDKSTYSDDVTKDSGDVNTVVVVMEEKPETMEMSGVTKGDVEAAQKEKKEGELKEEEDEEEEKSTQSKPVVIFLLFLRFVGLVTTLYFFVISLDLLGSAFTLLGGRAAGAAFQSSLLNNPVCGLMLGVIATAILQSSSTSTSIVVTMVAADILTVKMAIPIIMGSNIGTSVTACIVSVTQAAERDQFRRAFAAATVHDMFNWLSVLIFLPIEVLTGYLYHLTSAIVSSTSLSGGGSSQDFLKVITKPFTDLIIQLDKSVLDGIAVEDPSVANKSMLKYWCEYETVPVDPQASRLSLDWFGIDSGIAAIGGALVEVTDIPVQLTTVIGSKTCKYLFHGTSLSEAAVGAILLVIALAMLIGCLIAMVAILKSLLQGHLAGVIIKTINADFPKKFAVFTGYVAMLVGALATILVQSSSVVVSVLTPLVGVGMVSVERVYPMVLGANIGTTSTAVLASFASSGDRIVPAFQIALCHLFFNLSGILIWYPVPFMRRVPLRIANFLGETTAEYRWFAILFILAIFVVLPLLVFGLSIPGPWLIGTVAAIVFIIVLTIVIINVIQNKKPQWLPEWMRTWEFLPEWMRSLEPLDRLIRKMLVCCKCRKDLAHTVEGDGVCEQTVDDKESESTHTSESAPGLSQYAYDNPSIFVDDEARHTNNAVSENVNHRPQVVPDVNQIKYETAF